MKTYYRICIHLNDRYGFYLEDSRGVDVFLKYYVSLFYSIFNEQIIFATPAARYVHTFSIQYYI